MQPWRESGIVLSFKGCDQTLALRLACGEPPPRAGKGLGRTHTPNITLNPFQHPFLVSHHRGNYAPPAPAECRSSSATNPTGSGGKNWWRTPRQLSGAVAGKADIEETGGD